jgi:hypothetical protein
MGSALVAAGFSRSRGLEIGGGRAEDAFGVVIPSMPLRLKGAASADYSCCVGSHTYRR